MVDELFGKPNENGEAPAPQSSPVQGGDATKEGTGLRPAVWAAGLILIAAVLLVISGS